MAHVVRLGLLALVAGALHVNVLFAQALTASAPAAAPPAPSTEPAPPPAPPLPPPPLAGFVKIGTEFKPAVGRVVDVEKGDNGCYVTILDVKEREFVEVGEYALCTQKPPIKGKKVEIEYRLESMQAASCNGNPKCTKRETGPYISSIKVIP